LTSIFDRRELEVLTPLTDITLGILLDEGLLGYKEGSEEAVRATLEGREYLTIPSELVRLMEEGREWYKIQFISPAKRMQQAEEMQGILTTMEIAGNVAQVDPSVLDWIDRDVLLRRATELGGGPDELVQDTNTVNQIREMRAEQQAAAADLENKKVQSEIARNLAQAGNMAKTGGLMDEEPDMSEMGGAELGV
jgi:hypothetical protein